MDLSHPNLTAFIERLIDGMKVDSDDLKNIIKRLKWMQYMPVPPVIFRWFSKCIVARIKKIMNEKNLLKSATMVRNLISFMENSIEYNFLIMEYFLCNDRPGGKYNFTPPVVRNGKFMIGDTTFDKIVICPLVIDFGYKNMKQNGIYYNIPPQKPVTKQVKDLLNAINVYYHKRISLKTEAGTIKFDVSDDHTPREEKLFEIFPFMGISPDFYDYMKIEKMLNKYFSNFNGNDKPEVRCKMLWSKTGLFKGDLDNEEECKNIFAGIKVYPPLGYDPWPDACPACNENESKYGHCECSRAKVKLIYSFCCEKNIPLITHCSAGGFKATDDFLRLTNPANRWADVLNNFPKLKIDFAHFGSEDELWEKSIIGHIAKEGSNVFTDISCNCEKEGYYEHLESMITDGRIDRSVAERILFGTDFMINMLWNESYNSYLNCFINTKHIRFNKLKFCHENPEKFLFGGSIG
jgi:hypothetical protein